MQHHLHHCFDVTLLEDWQLINMDNDVTQESDNAALRIMQITNCQMVGLQCIGVLMYLDVFGYIV
jgi:uncharacterized protein Smg (DUF494 family)